MKKIITILFIAAICFIACNDPKDPPDGQMQAKIQAHADSLAKVDSLKKVQ